MLVDVIDLALLGKQAHWNVKGRRFRSLHLELDELVDDWRTLGDEVAERAVTIGAAPDGQAETSVEKQLWMTRTQLRPRLTQHPQRQAHDRGEQHEDRSRL